MEGMQDRWETEFWKLIGSGDGIQCPLVDSCLYHHNTGKCPYDERYRTLKAFELEKKHHFPDVRLRIESAHSCAVFTQIDRLANRYVMDHGVTHPPVPNEIACRTVVDKPIEIQSIPLKSLYGSLWDLRNRWVIQLNCNDPVSIQRYTLFHEVFHIIAHQNTNLVFHGINTCQGTRIGNFNTRAGDFNEMLANHFSACVITPLVWLEGKYIRTDNLDALSVTFEVPKVMLYVRLKRLGML
jgi:hypothetical protein